MRLREHFVRWMAVAIACGAATGAWALDPHRSLTQYSRKVWTQAEGLPQDTIRAFAQTADGYLWLGTEEGLARFDGYEFTIFDKRDGGLPSNYVTALAATADGALWIGTAAGLTEYRDRRFRTYTTRDGLPEDDAIMGLYAGHDRTLWIVAGGWLSHFENGRFTNYAPGPLTAVRAVVEDRQHQLWVGGMSGVARFSAGGFALAISEAQLAAKDYRAAEATLQPLTNRLMSPRLGWQLQYLLCRIQLADGRTNAALQGTTNLLAMAAPMLEPVLRGRGTTPAQAWRDTLARFPDTAGRGDADGNRGGVSSFPYPKQPRVADSNGSTGREPGEHRDHGNRRFDSTRRSTRCCLLR